MRVKRRTIGQNRMRIISCSERVVVMSQDALRSILQRASADPAFAEQLRRDPTATLAKVDLSTVERLALSCADEDALRRLQGEAVAGGAQVVTLFEGAALAATDEREVGRMFELSSTVMVAKDCAERKTNRVTSRTVTKCCWG
jgi:hypothetical protein